MVLKERHDLPILEGCDSDINRVSSKLILDSKYAMLIVAGSKR